MIIKEMINYVDFDDKISIKTHLLIALSGVVKLD